MAISSTNGPCWVVYNPKNSVEDDFTPDICGNNLNKKYSQEHCCGKEVSIRQYLLLKLTVNMFIMVVTGLRIVKGLISLKLY